MFVDTGNTDSDTITSEPSRDSIKSGEMKRSPSLDSISNQTSLQTSSVRNTISKSTAINNHNDVTTQLMHLVNSLSSPLSVEDTEKLYQAQIVPCTCVIVEEMRNLSTGESDSINELNNETDDLNKIKSNNETDYSSSGRDNTKKIEQMSRKVDNSIVEEAQILIPQKPKKSIFDLDFEDDDDPLQTIIQKNMSPAESNTHLQKPINNENDNSLDLKTLETVNLTNEANNIDEKQEEDDSDKVPEIVSIYTVHEDPNCVAKERFTVQTTNVTNFHINALHNYYVPNINGNWNSIESSSSSSLVLKSTISEFLKELDAYEVTAAAAVVAIICLPCCCTAISQF